MTEISAAEPIRLPAAGLRTILGPKWRTARARLRQERSGGSTKLLLLLLTGLAFWLAIFGIAYRLLQYTTKVPEIGRYLPGKMLGLVMVAFGAILLLSNLITALSTFFLAKDLDLLAAAPVEWSRLYAAKLTETVIHSSWMVALLAAPVFTAYGIVLHGGPLFPLVVLAAFVPYIALPAVVGAAATLLLVNVFPARRTRDLLGLIGIGAVAIAVVLLRVIRPEQLARPEGYRNLLDFIIVLRAPTNPWMPSEWAASMVMNWLHHVGDPLPPLLLWSTAGAFLVMGAALHRWLYIDGFSRAHEGAERVVRRPLRTAVGGLLRGMSPTRRELILKDVRLFFRDSTQWSQLILLGVLLLVYIFNIRTLPLFSGEQVSFILVTVISFLNLALAGFVLAAVAVRFIFPAVSLEGRQMWLLRSSPLELRTLLWSKYWIGTLPLLVLAVGIAVTTDLLLRVTPFMMGLSVATLVVYTLAIGALALGLGALYPQFDTENAAQIPTSFGGLVFMMASLTLLIVVVIIEARPVLDYLRAGRDGTGGGFTPELAVSFAAVTLVCLVAAGGSFGLALRRLQEVDR